MPSSEQDSFTAVDAKKIRSMIKKRVKPGDVVKVGSSYGIYSSLNAQQPLMKEGRVVIECYPLPSEADTSRYVELDPEIVYKGRRIQVSMSLKSIAYQGLLPSSRAKIL